jgi:hypothetical protein
MSDPRLYSLDQARDAGTPGHVLADIAALRPDLRPAVAVNPAAYPGLLHWLGELGEPAVDAALRARALATGGRTLVLPVPDDAGALAEVPEEQASGVEPSPWVVEPSRWAPAGQVPSPFGSAPAESQPFGAPPFAGPRAVGHGGPAGPGYGPSAPARRERSSRSVLWVVLGVVVGLVLLGVAGFLGLRAVLSSFVPDAYGSDAQLDALYDECSGEGWQACDDLYYESPLGSEYEEYGDTCGGRTDGGGFCAERFGVDPTGQSYGDDPALDLLWDLCADGDDAACDDLYSVAPADSEYESFGDSCGGRGREDVWCAP